MVALNTKSKNAAINFAPSRFVTGAGNLIITAARCSAGYLVIPIQTDFAGRAFVLAKVAGGSRGSSDESNYDVFIGGRGEHDSCTCKGHTFRPNQPNGCKHIAAMKAVLANGLLDVLETVEAILARIERAAAKLFPAPPEAALDALTALLFENSPRARSKAAGSKDYMADQERW